THRHDPARGDPLAAAQLEVNAELWMRAGERGGPDARANAAEFMDHVGTGQPLDLIAKDQDVDAGDNRALSHGGAPPDTGGMRNERSIPPPNRTRNTALLAEARPFGCPGPSCRCLERLTAPSA